MSLMHFRVHPKVTRLLDSISKLTRVAQWGRGYKDFLAIFNWHQVTPVFDPYLHHKYTWTRLEKFKKEVDYLTREFQILPLYEAIDRLKRGCLQGRCASLNFDDGDISIAEHVVPFLRQRDLPATLFINSAYLDSRRSYWFPILSYLSAVEAAGHTVLSGELKEKALKLRLTNDPRYYNEVRSRIEELASLVPNLGSRLVSAEWLSGLDGDQFAIGAHGHEHQRFSLMPAKWQRNDLRENVRVLARFRGYRPIFAVPFGRPHDWTEKTIEIGRNEGLDIVLADGGINLAAGDFYRRIPSDDRMLRPLVTAAMRQ
jgi:peptidoglycan/xylan/chitin deacetylase (PgdA/CDA1 family)